MANRLLLYWLPLMVWISGIFLASALPSHFFPRSRVTGSFSLHVTAFFILFVLFYRFFRPTRGKQLAGGVLIVSFAFTLLISFSKECWQLLFATRFFGLNDLLIDGGAALLGMLAVCIVSVCSLPKKPHKPHNPRNPTNPRNPINPRNGGVTLILSFW